MADGSKIQITTQVNLDDSQFKNKTREVLDFVQTLSKTKAYISPKLKFDTGDVRKELQSALTEAYRQLEKAYGVKKGEKLAYAGPKGGIRTVNTKDQQKRAIEYFSNRMDDKSLSQVERNQAERIVSAHRAYNDLIRQIQDLDRRARKAFTRSLDVDDEKLRAEEFKQFTRTNRRGKNIAVAENNFAMAKFRYARADRRLDDDYSVENINKAINALKELIAAENKYDKIRGKRQRNKDVMSYHNKALQGLYYSREDLLALKEKNKEQQKFDKAVFDASVKRRREADKNADIQNRIIKQYQQQYGILGGLGSRLRSYLSIYALANFGKKVADTTGYFEKQQVALEGILGSASKAQSVLSQIKDFALHSPFQTKELVTFTKQLAAFSIPSDQLFDTTKRLADISAGLGVEMSRIILAYGQVRSAAVLRGQELRQFTEAGIPLVQKLAEKFTQLRGELVTTADVFELISKRQVSFQMVADVLNDMTKEGGQFYKMQENITETLYGQMQKLQDMWTIQMDEMGKGSGGFFMGVVKLLQLIVKNASGVSAGLITAFALDWPIRNIRKLRLEWELMDVQVKKSIGSYEKFKKLRLSEFGKNLGWSIAAAGVGAAIGVVYQQLRKLGEVQRKMTEISDSFNKETNKMVGGFDDLVLRLRSARKGTKEYNDAIETLKTNYGEYLNVNDKTIQTLLSEQKAVEGNVSEYDKLREQLTSAIKLKQQFNELKTQKEALGDMFASEAEGSDFLGKGYRSKNEAILQMIKNIKNYTGGKDDSQILNSLFGTNYENASSKIKTDLNAIARATLEEFRAKGYTERSEFAALYERNFNNKFLSNTLAKDKNENIKNLIDGLSNGIFSTFENTDAFENYKETTKKLNGEGTDLLSSLVRINREFDSYNGGENEGVGAVGKQQWTNMKYAQLLRNSVSAEFWKMGGDVDKLGNLRTVLDAFINGEKYDEGGVRKVTDALKEFFDTIEDSERRSVVKDAAKRFEQGTDALTKQESDIANLMELESTWAGITRGKINNIDLQGFIDNYNPAALGEQTVQQTRDKLKSTYDDLKKDLKTYTVDPINFKEDIALIKAKMRIIERLAKNDLYAVDLSDNKKGPKTREFANEISELVSKLKDAYETYKKATQAEGADMGLAYMRGDEQMMRRFYNFFHGGKAQEGGTDVFLNEHGKEIRIGEAGVTLRELLGGDEMFLKGMEDGVIDFEKALRTVGQAMIDYAKANENTKIGMREFARQGRALLQQADQMSKDNVANWIANVNKEFQDLGKTFERTNKQVETYRALMEKGTIGSLGRYVGANRSGAMTTNSARNLAEVQAMVDLYNKNTKEAYAKTLGSGATADYSKLSLLDLKNLDSVEGILAAIQEVTKRGELNNNFGLDWYGQGGKEVLALLDKRLGIVIDELKSISGEQFTGKAIGDAMANALVHLSGARETLNLKQGVANQYGQFDGAALLAYYNALQGEVNKNYEAFLKSNDFAAMARATSKIGALPIDLEAMKARLQKIIDELVKKGATDLAEELQRKMENLEISVKEFNAKTGSGYLTNLKDFFNADDEAFRRFREESRKNKALNDKKSELGLIRSDLEARIDSGINPDGTALSADQLKLMNETLKYYNEEWNKNEVAIAASDVALENMGNNGEKLANNLREAAATNMKAAAQAWQSDLNTITDAVHGVTGAFGSLANTISKAWDIMADGENPDALQDLTGFIEDFGSAFDDCMAPITAVMTLIITMTALTQILGKAAMQVFLPLMAAAALFAGLLAIFQMHDKKLERQIKRVQRHIEETQNAMKNLEAIAERSAGYKKLGTEIEALSKNWDVYLDKLKQVELEKKKKNTDKDKVREYAQGAQEALDEALNSLKSTTDEITASIQDWASSLSDALRSAFKNGENAARAFRNTAIEMVGDIVNKIIEMTILEPMMENAMKGLLNYSLDKNDSDYIGNQARFQTDGKMDPKKIADYVMTTLSNDNASGIYQFLREVESGYGTVIDWINNELAKPLKEAWAYNSDTSALSGGIQGMTEDTARTLEGLENSKLAQHVITNRYIQDVSPLLQAQLSDLRSVLAEQRLIRTAVQNIENLLSGRSVMTRPIRVKME